MITSAGDWPLKAKPSVEKQINGEQSMNFDQDLAGFGLAAFAPLEILRKISQNLSPAVAPTDEA